MVRSNTVDTLTGFIGIIILLDTDLNVALLLTFEEMSLNNLKTVRELFP